MKKQTSNNRLLSNTPIIQLGKTLLIASLMLFVTACGGNKQVPVDPQTGDVVEDITRPPETIVGRKEVEERNPEETISFDEWRKRRLEEQRQQQTP